MKTVALVVLGFLFVVLALHQPEVPRPVEHPVELAPAFAAMQHELAHARTALAAAEGELRAYRAAAAQATADREREARWAAAADAEARGALRTASRLYDDYAKAYPGTKKAELAATRAKKLLADVDAGRVTPAGGAPAAPTAAAVRR